MLENYCSIALFSDNRFELNNDLRAIVDMTRPNKHQSRTVGQKLPSNFMQCGAKF